RTGTGSSVNARVSRASFRLLRGAEHVHAFQPAGGIPKHFCNVCGSALFSGEPFSDAEFAVRLGTLDRDPGVALEYRQFVNSAAAWEAIPDDGLRRYPRSRGA
ncbi:MAG TPA: GFA family protein, partial [Solirubrobacteraceae bacterium]|nr:GFA family protein [Solirubrobacteraceae bacterium]